MASHMPSPSWERRYRFGCYLTVNAGLGLFGGPAVPFLVYVAGVGLRLGRLHDLVLMLGRGVEGVKLERSAPGVADIMAGAGGDDDAAAVGYPVAIVVNVDPAGAFFEAE